MVHTTDDMELSDEQQMLFDKMCALIDAQTDGLVLMAAAQDMVGELLRRGCDTQLREQALGEISRFFLGILKAPNLSEQYKMGRLKVFARATIKLLLERRAKQTAQALAAPPPGLARRAGDRISSPD